MVLKHYLIYYFIDFCSVQVCYKCFFPSWTMSLKAKLTWFCFYLGWMSVSDFNSLVLCMDFILPALMTIVIYKTRSFLWIIDVSSREVQLGWSFIKVSFCNVLFIYLLLWIGERQSIQAVLPAAKKAVLPRVKLLSPAIFHLRKHLQ